MVSRPGGLMASATVRRSSQFLRRALSYLVVVKETLLFNKFLYTCGQRHSKLLHVWFSAGVISGILTMLAAVLVFALDSSKALLFLSRTASVEEPSYLISPVVPGINVPWADVGYISFGTAISIALHELGHALAATSEGVHVEHVAAFMAVIFLGALVALDTEALQLLSPQRALRIYCAGVWHNIMCCAGCWLILQSLPSLLLPFYSHNMGVLVYSISPQSPLSPHLKIGDVIKKVNGISIHSSQELVENLLKLNEEKTHSALGVGHISRNFSSRGYCVPLDILNGTELVDNHTCSSDSFPFSQVPPLNSKQGKTVETGRINCLQAMNIIRQPPCGFTWTMSCPLMQVCMEPKLSPGEVLVTLDFIPQNFRWCQHSNNSSNCKNELIFVGEVGDLLVSLQFGNYLPRSLSSYSAPYWLPQVLEKLVTYLFNISAAIAILNSAPVFYFDGQDMLHGYLRVLGSYISPRRRRYFMQICLRVCSFVLICEILRGFVLVLM